MTQISRSAEHLFDRIEALELRSLRWGYADGSLSFEDAKALFEDQGDSVDPEDAIEELVEAKLLFELPLASGQTRLRSRFAEYVRLSSRLKQLFPGKSWRTAPRLITDYRVDVRRRRYPKRDRRATDLAGEFSDLLASPPIRKVLWQALAIEPNLTLSGFQARSVERLLGATQDTATIVTAGTGSGKTLSFYLPALLRIGEQIEPHERWVKALAIYPRKELLKDQLAEAYRRARALDQVLIARRKRPVVIGALFSSTPRSSDEKSLQQASWSRHPSGYVCPWLKCERCKADLVWRRENFSRRVQRLDCSNTSCGSAITDDQLILTRDRLTESPPDLLFATSEMLNQRLSDLKMRRLFGVGMKPQWRPTFALLDEVHTYDGTSGAHAALVLRRWRHLLNNPVAWVGLSATLAQADRFFSELTGVEQSQVVEITPLQDEMIEEGADYQLILRGDPTLQTSLLSATIQSAMLCARMLEPKGSGRYPYFGRRLFVFTDDLDVTNRLYANILDAEGFDIFGKSDGSRSPLAALRSAGAHDRRDPDGQRWWASEQLGWALDKKLIVGRTSSQDAGVLAGADVVVATATLEVGYSDDEVGAVIQHKAPRNASSFLQRKGRAGRIRGMRPVTVTLLSEYGRDRVAFQAYEHLFSPSLSTQHLPVENQYLLRMQAVFSMLDWLAQTTGNGSSTGWMWDILSRPGGYGRDQLKHALKEQLNGLINGRTAIVSSLKQHLCASLRISDVACDAILWEPPRSLLMEAAPTLARRFFQDWKLIKSESANELDFKVDYHPLPDFIPRNLFSDLNLPEVQVVIPPATVNHTDRVEVMPILQTLRQLAPGRVTRRFAFERGGLYHWVPVDPSQEKQVLDVHAIASEAEQIGIFAGQNENGAPVELPVFRPWTLRLHQVSVKQILPTSNSIATWCSGFVPLGESLSIDVPSKSAWSTFAKRLDFYLHRFRTGVAVRRFSPGARATIRQRTGEKLVDVTYAGVEGLPAALGFELEVDGFSVEVELPAMESLLTSVLPGDLKASCHSAYLRHQLLSDDNLPPEFNTLQREWIFQIWIAATVQQAIRDGVSPAEASRAILAADPTRTFLEALHRLFQVQLPEEDDEQTDDEAATDSSDGINRVSRLEERLQASMAVPAVIASLHALTEELASPDAERYGAWLMRTVHETLAEAVLQACIDIAPRRAAVDTLLVDIETVDKQRARVWVTESTIGGGGVIEAFADLFAADPLALFRAVQAAIEPGDLELSTDGLDRFVDAVVSDVNIESLTAVVRNSVGHEARERARACLYEALGSKELDVGRSLSVSLNTRLLGSGASEKLYALLDRLVKEWKSLEERIIFSIGLREFCAIAIELSSYRSDLLSMLADAGRSNVLDGELIGVLGGLMWPRGLEIRQRTLQSYNPFRQRRLTDPALVRSLLVRESVPKVDATTTAWPEELAAALRTHGTAQLVAPLDVGRRMRQVVVQAMAKPVDIGYLQFFPVVERVDRLRGTCVVTVSIREHS